MVDLICPTPTSDPELVVFCSFDLVGSTAYKHSEPDKWRGLIKDFYIKAQGKVSELWDEAKLWKRLGDEVIFIQNISVQQSLQIIPQLCSQILDQIDKYIAEVSRDMVRVKGVLWVAACGESDCARNCIIPAEPDVSRDYIGPEVDIGFRLGKFSQKKRFVVSAELAYLTWTAKKGGGNTSNVIEAQDHLRIVHFEIMKGVWSGRAYPILWYFPEPNNLGMDIHYDDFLKSPIYQNILNGQVKKIDELYKIYQEVQQLSVVENLQSIVDSLPEKLDEEKRKKRFKNRLSDNLDLR